jgi:hypothetical protein
MTNTIKSVIKKGNTKSITLTWKTKAGVAVDLTGYAAQMQARKNIEDSATLFDLNIGSGITIDAPTTGVIEIEISDTITNTLPDGSIFSSVRVTSGAGVVTTIADYEFNVVLDATR